MITLNYYFQFKEEFSFAASHLLRVKVPNLAIYLIFTVCSLQAGTSLSLFPTRKEDIIAARNYVLTFLYNVKLILRDRKSVV